jgi:hypothetical protein
LLDEAAKRLFTLRGLDLFSVSIRSRHGPHDVDLLITTH